MRLKPFVEGSADGDGRMLDRLPFSLCLELTVTDPEVITALTAHPEGSLREEFALHALRIGVLALKQAQGQIDAAAIRQEGDRLLQSVERVLLQHQQLVNERLTAQLKEYFDPQSGRFQERVERLIRQDGELEQLLRRNIGDSDSQLCKTLAEHIGEGSPLMRILDPRGNDGVAAAVRQAVEEKLHDQRQRILEQFSLDNKDGALCRFLQEVRQHYEGISGDLAEKVDKAIGEFSLDDENSALSRLVSRVKTAQETITREFSLDEKQSALSRLRGELVELLEKQSASNREFQEEVKVAIRELKARKEEAARSTRHGTEFEDCLFSVVQAEAQRCGDLAEFTRHNPGLISRCKVGDVVVELGPDSAAPCARIVFEAKEMQGYDLRKALEELDVARKNRGAQVGVFVFSAKCAPPGLEPLLRFGSNIVVTWDSDDASTDLYVRVALTLGKALCVGENRRNEAEASDLAEMEHGVQEIESRLKELETIRTSATTIQNGAEKILSSEKKLRKTIEEQVELLRERIHALRCQAGHGADAS